jgi:hypothetical protein
MRLVETKVWIRAEADSERVDTRPAGGSEPELHLLFMHQRSYMVWGC